MYDVEGIKDVSSMLSNITTNINDMKSNIQSAKLSISNMQSLGFLDTKYNRIEQIEANVSGTDQKLASQIEWASK